jgi:three-Cys-motif partner protein
VPVPRTTRWPLDPHTRAKHQILRWYLDAWLPIMAKWNGRIIFLDGFAGPGRYAGGEEGSPLIALRALLEHPYMTPLPSGAEIRFHFVEEQKDRVASLEAEIANFKAARLLPQGVHVHVARDRFDTYLGTILDGLEKAGKQIAPTFAFIDPFGFSGVPMVLMRRLGANPKCEVLISFMYESITRWVAHPDPKIQAHLDDLFGTAQWRAIAAETDPDRRRDGLVELYRRRLIAAGFPYVLEFELRDKGNRTEYFLCFGTKSLKGARRDEAGHVESRPGGRQGVLRLHRPQPTAHPRPGRRTRPASQRSPDRALQGSRVDGDRGHREVRAHRDHLL